jgi:Arc/MetJ-type ribon-helix-helix transcriptional regulator
MSKRITVYLPDDVAARVEQSSNASAFVANAIRLAMRQEEVQRALAEAGIVVTPEGVAAMRERYEAGKRKLARRTDAA